MRACATIFRCGRRGCSRWPVLNQRSQLRENWVWETTPPAWGRGCVGVLPPHTRRCLRELVHNFVESEVHGSYKQAADLLGVERHLQYMEL